MGLETPISQEARALSTALHGSTVAFSYYDSTDRLRFWNEGYEYVNFRSRHLIREGAYFPDLLAELLARKQIKLGKEAEPAWLEKRIMQRRYGATAIRELTNGRSFLVQERKDRVGGTLGFWLDITDLVQAGAHMSSRTVLTGGEAPLTDPGPQVQIRDNLQTLLCSLELLRSMKPDDEAERLIGDALVAGKAIGSVIDHERRRA